MVDFGAGPKAYRPRTQVLDLSSRDDGPVPVDGPVDWSKLAKLPHLLTVAAADVDDTRLHAALHTAGTLLLM